MKNTLRLFLAFLLFSTFAQAQVKITGKVVDEQTGSPLGYATIQLMKSADDQLAGGGLSDDNGLFSMDAESGEYYLLLDFMGYQQLKTDAFTVGKKNFDFGTVKLVAQASTLDEVVVQAEKSTMELALDKRIFNVGKDLGNAGGSAVEILNNIPSVTVDVEGGVRLRGSNNVRILIDGKPSGLVSFKGGSGLQQLQASLIEKVEIITNPSARYEAEGMAGIINIVLKKERRQGLNGSFETTLGAPLNVGAGANLNYRHNKVNFFINYGINYRKTPSYTTTYQEVYDNDTTFISEQEYDGIKDGFDNNIRGGLDFFFDERNILTASYMLSRSDGKRLTDLRYDDYFNSTNNLDSYTLRTQDESEIEPISEYVLSYKSLFKRDGHELNASVRYMDHWETSDQIYEQATYFPDGSRNTALDLYQTSLNDETEEQLLLQVDYVQPFASEGKLEIGLRSSFRDMENDYLVQERNENGIMETLPGLDNNFIYQEDIHAVYGIIGNKANRFSYQFGVRAEWTDIETILEETRESNPRQYANLFPSAHFTYDLPAGHAVQLSYSRRVQRPTYRDLSPFITFSDNRNYFSGNPDLNPEFSDVFELGHVKYFDKGSISSSVYYRHVNDKIINIRSVDSQGFSNSLPQNLATENAYGAEFTSGYNFTKWWKLDFSFNFFRSRIDGTNVNDDFSSDTYTWFSRQTSRFILNPSTDLQFRANYEAPMNTPQGKRKSLYFFDIAINKDIFKEKGTLTLNITDIFNTRIYRSITEGDIFYSLVNAQRIRRQVNLNFSYRLNQ